jgi:hypothetical protein
MNVSPG